MHRSFLRGGSPGGTHFLIDPCFRDQFAIPKATHRYQSLLAAVPPVFVGPEERLRQLVELLCQVGCLCSLCACTLVSFL